MNNKKNGNGRRARELTKERGAASESALQNEQQDRLDRVRVTAAHSELLQLLDRHGCELFGIPQFTPAGPAFTVTVSLSLRVKAAAPAGER
jgi:protoporphyrinogen oxidase